MIRWAVGVTLVAGGVLVGVLLLGGGAPAPVPSGLPDPGPVTGWGLPAARLVADLAASGTVGFLLAAAVLLPSRGWEMSSGSARAASLACPAAAGWLIATLFVAVLSLSDLFGVPPSQVLDLRLMSDFVIQTTQGRGLLFSAAYALIVAVSAPLVRSRVGAAVLALAAAAGIVPPALAGHVTSAGSPGVATASLVLHVVAAAVWVGGLAALAWAAAVGDGGLHAALPRFSAVALACFGAVAVSGLVNASVRLDGVGPLFGTSYGRLVLAKTAALLLLGLFGWWHRRRTLTLTGVATRGRFLRVAATELVVMAATVSLAVGLSRTPTPSESETALPAEAVVGLPASHVIPSSFTRQ